MTTQQNLYLENTDKNYYSFKKYKQKPFFRQNEQEEKKHYKKHK